MKKILTTLTLLSIYPVQSAKTLLRPVGEHSITMFVKNLDSGKIDPNIKLNATYGGYTTTTNDRGQLLFPRKTQAKNFNVVVTPQIKPIFSVLNNVSHWQIPDQIEAKIYAIKMISDDSKQIWQTTMKEVPVDHHIPLHSIIILANPDQIEMELGSSEVKTTEQLLLPAISAKTNALSLESAIALPDNEPFFKRLKTAYSLTPYGYAALQSR